MLNRDAKTQVIKEYFGRPMPYLFYMNDKELDEFYSYVKFMNKGV
jgi:hypothetical protein